MAAFGRRGAKRDKEDVDGGVTKRPPALSRQLRRKQLERDKLDATPPWETSQRTDAVITTGPYDSGQLPADDLVRVDLGGLRLPVVEGVDIRVDAGPDGSIVAATVVHHGSQMQLGVFAAPRAEGIWDEIRAELVESVTGGGGAARDHADGTFGVELRGELAGARGATTPVRFIGVDGPRWFLRAMLVGPAATDDAEAEPLEAVLRETVVVRGREPLPVREPVPLHLPKDDTDGGAGGSEGGAAAGSGTDSETDRDEDPNSSARDGD